MYLPFPGGGRGVGLGEPVQVHLQADVGQFLPRHDAQFARQNGFFLRGSRQAARRAGDPMATVLEGIDDAWEISLLKFGLDMVQKSQGINLFDFKRRGLL